MAEQKASDDIKNNDENCANFTGIWELKTNENLDEFMKSQGIGYMKRKMASMASITLTIQHKNGFLNVKSKLPIGGEREDELPLDGTEKQITNPMGEEVIFAASWKDDNKQVLIVKTNNLTRKKKVTTERFMPDKDTLKDKMTNTDGVTMTRTFKRKAQ